MHQSEKSWFLCSFFFYFWFKFSYQKTKINAQLHTYIQWPTSHAYDWLLFCWMLQESTAHFHVFPFVFSYSFLKILTLQGVPYEHPVVQFSSVKIVILSDLLIGHLFRVTLRESDYLHSDGPLYVGNKWKEYTGLLVAWWPWPSQSDEVILACFPDKTKNNSWRSQWSVGFTQPPTSVCSRGLVRALMVG